MHYGKLYSYVARSISSPELSEKLLEIESVRGQRPVRSSKCFVHIPEKLNIFPIGCIVGIIGRKDNLLFNEIREGLVKNNETILSKLDVELDRMRKILLKPLDALDEGGKEVNKLEIPTISEIRYNKKTLGSFIVVTKDFPLFFQLYAYSGGEIDYNKFELVEYYDIDKDESMESIIIIKPPIISAIEKTALQLVSGNRTEVNVSADVIGWLPVAAIAAVARTAAKAIVRSITGLPLVIEIVAAKNARSKNAITNTDESRELLKSLKHEATAQELLEIRRKLLLLSLYG